MQLELLSDAPNSNMWPRQILAPAAAAQGDIRACRLCQPLPPFLGPFNNNNKWCGRAGLPCEQGKVAPREVLQQCPSRVKLSEGHVPGAGRVCPSR